ncbi:Hsp20/alpha crystallin family protein [Maribacter sp. 2307ULW6-5]|uniref:Hsp20/alpha crystallin family protein n=1 Tax=Maribacter sp. 2307ULW6-5 TaxID=3386275 RepID=UPI0039BD55DE
MNLIKRNDLLFPQLMNEMFAPDWFGGKDHFNALPPVNIKEDDHGFSLSLSVPGRVKDDFNIEVDDHVLTISTEVKEEHTETEGKFTRREFGVTAFKRSFTLPETVNEEGIEATYENGILHFSLPKKEEALPKPKRMIELS